MSEVIIYVIMAAVVCTMLYMVLGKQVGQPPETPLVPEAPARDIVTEMRDVRRSRHFEGPAGQGLAEIAKADPSFDPDTFIDNAQSAYSMILEGYAEGDKDTLAMLLSEDMNAAYAGAIDARDARGVTQTTDLARIIRAEFVDADQSGKTATITVEYEAEIASAIINSEGEVVEGDPDRLAHVTELWSYSRKAGSKTPNWTLVSVEEAGEDTLGSAPDYKPDEND